jgi:hypothetical protein
VKASLRLVLILSQVLPLIDLGIIPLNRKSSEINVFALSKSPLWTESMRA